MSTKIEERLEALEGSVKSLTEAVATGSRVKVKFQVKKTDSGIEVVGGPTTVEKTGTVVGVVPMPAPGAPQGTMMLGAVVVDEAGMVGTVGPIEALKFVL